MHIRTSAHIYACVLTFAFLCECLRKYAYVYQCVYELVYFHVNAHVCASEVFLRTEILCCHLPQRANSRGAVFCIITML